MEGDVVDGRKCGLSFERGENANGAKWDVLKRTGLQTWQLSEELQSVGRGNLQIPRGKNQKSLRSMEET